VFGEASGREHMSERTRDPDRRGESQTSPKLSRYCHANANSNTARTHTLTEWHAARSEAACRMTTALRPLQRHPVARPRISLSATSDRTMAPPARSAVPPIARKDTALCVWPALPHRLIYLRFSGAGFRISPYFNH